MAAPLLLDIGIARFSADGILDTSFGTGGIVRVVTPDVEWMIDLAVDAADRILVSGNHGLDGFVARYNPDGSQDAGFDASGVGSVLVHANGIALDDAGRILVVGEANDDLGVVRLLADGSIDTTFGPNGEGLVTADFYGDRDEASDVVIQADGRIIVGGVARNGFTRTVGLARVLP